MKHLLDVLVTSDKSSTEVAARIQRMLNDRFEHIEVLPGRLTPDLDIPDRIKGFSDIILDCFAMLKDMIETNFPELRPLVSEHVMVAFSAVASIGLVLINREALCTQIKESKGEPTGDKITDALKRSFMVDSKGAHPITTMSKEDIAEMPEEVLHKVCHLVAEAKNIQLECPMPREQYITWLEKHMIKEFH